MPGGYQKGHEGHGGGGGVGGDARGCVAVVLVEGVGPCLPLARAVAIVRLPTSLSRVVRDRVSGEG